MVKTYPIRCPACGKVVIKDAKSLSHYVMQEDIRCSTCSAVVVRKPGFEW